MQSFYTQHQVAITLGSYIVLSNAVNSLPSATEKSSNFYKWFFTFSHAIMLQAGRFINKGANGNENQSNHVNVDSPVVK